MDDLHSINQAINQRAGRKLGASIIVSIVLVALVFGSLAIAPALFAILVGVAVLLALRELNRAFAGGEIHIPNWVLWLSATGILLAAYFAGTSGLSMALAVAIPNACVALLFLSPLDFLRRSAAAALAIVYIPFLAGYVILLAHQSHNSQGLKNILTVVLLVSCNDTFAYFSGVLFGKHLMAPRISPKKTWEGFAGSVIATTIAASWIYDGVIDRKWYFGALLGLMAVVTSTVGDLIESALKRDLSIKDMGSILPGHGGILDRIDSLLYTAPAVWLFLELLKHLGALK
jgi:phosphatidate cytidylyltransferase